MVNLIPNATDRCVFPTTVDQEKQHSQCCVYTAVSQDYQ